MEPNRFGRKLGIGVRVASRMAKERAAKAATATPSSAAQAATAAPPLRPARSYAEPARRVGEGTRRFGQAFFGPLKHVSGTLWLEITGLFFALFAIFFGQSAWRAHSSALHGPEHAHFLLYAVVTLVFVYFCVSSFVKAMRRSRRMAR